MTSERHCQYCGKEFARKYEARRHEDAFCPDRPKTQGENQAEKPWRNRVMVGGQAIWIRS